MITINGLGFLFEIFCTKVSKCSLPSSLVDVLLDGTTAGVFLLFDGWQGVIRINFQVGSQPTMLPKITAYFTAQHLPAIGETISSQ